MKGLKILLIDDSESMRFILSEALETPKHKHKVVAVASTLDALKRFEVEAGENGFDLVVSDVHDMPLMLGGEFIRRIKAVNPKVKTILTSSYLPTSEGEITKSIGADAYLNKGDFYEEVHRLIDSLFPNRQS